MVRLGAQRVLTTITYPEWFQYPKIAPQVRQQLIDNYTTREYLLSFDESVKNAPSTHWVDLSQTLLDLFGWRAS